MAEEQSSLFSEPELRQIRASRFRSREPTAPMSAYAINTWKQRVFKFQSQVQVNPLTLQGSLFELIPNHPNPDSIDPFQLRQYHTEFWKWTFEDEGVAALYFVIDAALPLLLYVGETCQSNVRWKGQHDCKRYLQNYVSAHRQQDLLVRVSIGFWQDAPKETRPRQQLEQALIQKWRSPFNKENWHHWGNPFVGGK